MMSIPPTSNDGLAINSLLINAMPGKHLVLLPDAPAFTIAAVSDDYLTAVGVQREHLVGNGVFAVFFGEGRNEAAALQLHQSLTQVIRSKQIHGMTDQPHQWPNAQTGTLERRIWRVVNKPVMGSNGELAYIINTVEDVTSQVELVEVAQANRYLQTIINLFKEPLQVVEPVFEQGELIDFRFTLTNQAFAAYANATPQQLRGKRVGEVFPGYFDTTSFANLVETAKTGQPLTFEIHYDKDGLDLYNLMSTSRLDQEVVVHFTDFTRLRHLQQQLERKIQELTRSNENLQQFAYVASHDLQEPLRKIQQFGDLLEHQYADQLGPGLDYLHRMQSGATRMATLIKDLLSFSQIATQPETTTPVDLNQVLEGVLSDLELRIAETGARVEQDALPTLNGDRSQLQQLFFNLLANALKFHRRGDTGAVIPPQISVRTNPVAAASLPASVKPTRVVDWYHQIEVADNGVGFDEKYVERIFQLFKRLHGQSEFSGTGIGLAICAKVVSNHGGAITARSQVDQGATFILYLPG